MNVLQRDFSRLGRIPLDANNATHMDRLVKENERQDKEKDDERLRHEQWLASLTLDADPEDAKILADALRHLTAASKLPMPIEDRTDVMGSRWKTWAETMLREAQGFTSCKEAVQFAQSNIPFDHRTNVKEDKSEFDLFNSLLIDEYPWLHDFICGCKESELSRPETLSRLNGRLVSNIFYWHMRVMAFIMTQVDNPKRILELGGGYGSLARLWLMNKETPIERYVIADLPESLFFSEVFLQKEIGSVGYWEGEDPGTRVVLVPIQRLDEYKAASDVVINVGSLQEMSDNWVSHYMHWLDRYDAKFFYSLNYMGQPIQMIWESRTFWAPRLSPQWATRVINPDPPLIKMMCMTRYFAEMLYEKTTPTRTLDDWSVLKGNYLTRATYLEGLELLRQNMTVEHACKFIYTVINTLNEKPRMLMPKELMIIAQTLLDNGNTMESKRLGREAMDGLKKIVGNITA